MLYLRVSAYLDQAVIALVIDRVCSLWSVQVHAITTLVQGVKYTGQ